MKNKKEIMIGVFIGILISGIYLIFKEPRMSEEETRKYVIAHFDNSFLAQYPDLKDRNIKCNKEEIFEKKLYTFVSVDYIEYHCTNGNAIVYRFDKGLGRSVMLADWHPSKTTTTTNRNN